MSYNLYRFETTSIFTVFYQLVLIKKSIKKDQGMNSLVLFRVAVYLNVCGFFCYAYLGGGDFDGGKTTVMKIFEYINIGVVDLISLCKGLYMSVKLV